MYITLAFTPLNGKTHGDVEDDIAGPITKRKFDPAFQAYPGLIFASISKGANEQEAQRLYKDLMKVAPGNFDFVITVSVNGEPAFPSDNLITPDDPGFDALETFQT